MDMDRKLQEATATVTTRSAFVAGASGYTGRALVHELRRRGVSTIAHIRPDSSALDRLRPQFESLGATVDTTAWTEDAMTATLRRYRPAAVFALLGTTRARMKQSDGTDSYESVDYGLTALLLRAVMAGAPAARFVYLSAVGVGLSARGGYLQARWRLEEELRASGAAWTLARPAFITGDREESRPLERISGAIIDGVLRVAGALGAHALRDRYSSLTAGVLARGLAYHAFEKDSAGRILGADDLRRVPGIQSAVE